MNKKTGILHFRFTEDEKKEVKQYLKSLPLEYQQGTIVLDKDDLPAGLDGQLPFADLSEGEIHKNSQNYLRQIRQYKESQNLDL